MAWTVEERLTNLESTRSFEMFYRYGSAKPITKIFRINGTLRDAVDKAITHCKKMGYIHIITKPYEVNLDEQEKLKLENPDAILDDVRFQRPMGLR